MQDYERLEVEFGRWMGLEEGSVVACSSGTAALHLALEALRLPPGSEVLVPDYTMVACARAVALAGLTPVFVDCGDNLLMDDGESFGNASVDRYSAFMAVHIYGRRMDMDWISSTAGLYHSVIEDMAEIHGVRPHPDSDAACWSFYKNKIVAGEEGGAIWFRDPQHAALARELRTLGFTAAHDFRHVPRGHNYRLANALARPILESLNLYDWNLQSRRRIEGWYDELCPPGWKMPFRDAPWVYDIRVPDLTWERQHEVVRALNEVEIAARCGFKPMSLQEEFRSCRAVGTGNVMKASRETFYLPLTPYEVGQEEAKRAFELLRKMLG